LFLSVFLFVFVNFLVVWLLGTQYSSQAIRSSPGYKDVLDLIHTSCINNSHVSIYVLDGGPHVSRFFPVVWLLKMIFYWWVMFKTQECICDLKKKNYLRMGSYFNNFTILNLSTYGFTIPFNIIRTRFWNSYQWYIYSHRNYIIF